MGTTWLDSIRRLKNADFFTGILWSDLPQRQVMPHGRTNLSHTHNYQKPESTPLYIISLLPLLVFPPTHFTPTSYRSRKYRHMITSLLALLQWHMPGDTSLLPQTGIDMMDTVMVNITTKLQIGIRRTQIKIRILL